MTSGPATEPMRPPVTPTATKWATNHDWSRRGQYKPKAKK